MRKLIFIITLTLLIGGLLAPYRTLSLAAPIPFDLFDTPEPPVFYRSENLALDLPHPGDVSNGSCARPQPRQIRECLQLEQQILASTVRLEWHRWLKPDDDGDFVYLEGNSGYATIKQGRYLVTHNHPGVSLSDSIEGELTTISVFTTRGEPVSVETPVTDITIAVEDEETLVLDFGAIEGRGLFDARGLSSVEFKTWESLPLEPGMEVAQLDWDGSRARINWVTIDQVVTTGGTPRLKLASFVALGSSGGGVFWNGYHVANNWSRVTIYEREGGPILSQHSVAALNSPQVTAQQSPHRNLAIRAAARLAARGTYGR